MTTTLAAAKNNTLLSGDAFTNPAYYEHVKSLAGVLANGAFTPKHLIAANNPGRTLATCTRVVIQALRWGFDIFAVADETYEVHGRMGYQGKLIIAVVNARAGLNGRLNFSYKGTGQDLTVTVSGQFADEDKPKEITLSVKQASTSNDMWKKDPEQKLAYSGAVKWARRYCPELVMGVRTVEDVEMMHERGELQPLEPLAGARLAELGNRIQGKNLPAPRLQPDATFPVDPMDEAVDDSEPPEFANAFTHCTTAEMCDAQFADMMKDDPTLQMSYAAARDFRKGQL